MSEHKLKFNVELTVSEMDEVIEPSRLRQMMSDYADEIQEAFEEQFQDSAYNDIDWEITPLDRIHADNADKTLSAKPMRLLHRTALELRGEVASCLRAIEGNIALMERVCGIEEDEDE